jgi:hemerythrin superfamily protein
MSKRNEARSNGRGGLLKAIGNAIRGGLQAASTAGDETLDALDLLKVQHRQVERLFAAIEGARGTDEKQRAFRELADLLAVHATIEERIFYPGVKTAETEDLLRESVEEHLAVKRVIADLLGVSAADPRFAAQISVLKEMVEHHAREEEEGKLFPTVRAATDGDYRAGLAGEMIALMVALDQEGPPRLAVRSETGRAAPV